MLVSIIIPCYNVEEYVADCLESAIRQTHRPIEIIAVDNNSTDDTLKVLNRYAKLYPDLISVLQEINQGVSCARNKGLRKANGEWVQYLDADDYLLDDKIKRQVSLLANGHNLNIIIGGYEMKTLKGKGYRMFPKNGGDILVNYAFRAFGQTSANLFKRDAIIQVGNWDEHLINAEDTDLIYRIVNLAPTTGVIFDMECNAIYRLRPIGQLTNQKNSQQYLNNFTVRLRQYQFISKHRSVLLQTHGKLFKDMLYYPIFCLGIHDIKAANILFKKYLLRRYRPSYRPGYISFFHCMAVSMVGFSNFLKLRSIAKNMFHILRIG